MNNIMLTANQARAKAQNDNVIFNEIRDIEDAILTAVDNGSYDVKVAGTTMTATVNTGPVPSPRSKARIYFNVWQGTQDDRAKFIQMAKIITYFTDLGYTIDRRTNNETGDTFTWLIYW